jgi:hypothetical protein
MEMGAGGSRAAEDLAKHPAKVPAEDVAEHLGEDPAKDLAEEPG